jgi:hypothetical protein
MDTIELKNFPEIKRVIQSADPTYKKRKAFITITEKVELYGTYWDSGSRNTFTAVNLATGSVVTGPQYAPPQFNGPKETPVVILPDGIVMVKTGYFCGKTATATVYVNPKNATKFLPGA